MVAVESVVVLSTYVFSVPCLDSIVTLGWGTCNGCSINISLALLMYCHCGTKRDYDPSSGGPILFQVCKSIMILIFQPLGVYSIFFEYFGSFW